MMKLLKNLKPYLGILILSCIFIFIQAITDLYLPTLMGNIVDIGIVNKDNNYILKVGLFMLLIAFIGSICSIGASFLGSKIALGFSKDVRKKVFEKVESFSLNEFDEIGTASLITRTTNDIMQVQQVIVVAIRMMVSAPLTLIGALIMAYSKDSKLAFVFVIIVPLILIVIFIIGKLAMPLFKLLQKRLDYLNLVVREKLIGIRIIRVFNRIDYERKRFDKASLDYSKIAIKANRIMGLMMPLMILILNLSIVSVIWLGGIRIENGSLQVGNLMAFIQYLSQIMFSLMMLSMMFVLIPRASACAVRINEVLDIIPQINDNDIQEKVNNDKICVEFKNVTFSYGDAEHPAVENISFTAKSGEVTAIIGGTGSGKSTLLNLIPRFYDISSGSILIDGKDIKNISQQELRSKIGYIPQKSVLFSGTIKENVLYGKENATDKEVLKAIDISQSSDFVSKMKDGVNSYISQGGTNISGGQKQRLSIARALVRKAKIYLFDDSFSALDFKTDAKLRDALKREVKNATMIIVAQRVSTIIDADKIIVLDEGKVAGIGTHEELLNSCEVYKEIVSSQLSRKEVN